MQTRAGGAVEGGGEGGEARARLGRDDVAQGEEAVCERFGGEGDGGGVVVGDLGVCWKEGGLIFGFGRMVGGGKREG